jgi:thiol-disulfide isomerase/thioredoxin
MKTGIISALAMALAVLPGTASGQAQNSTDLAAEFEALVVRIQTKIRAGQATAENFSAEKADFAALRAKSAGGDPELAAKVAHREYTFYLDVLKDRSSAAELRKDLETKYRDYLGGTQLGQELAMRELRVERARGQAALVGKPAPELNFIWSNRPGLSKLSELKGKVVVLDFWATWCGPCVATFPQIRELVEHYKGSDVVVLGVTSRQGYVAGLTPVRIETADPQKEFAVTADFIKAKQMTWPVVFTDARVFNPDYGVTGIPHMAIIAPDGTIRHNGLHPGMPHAEKLEKIDEILKEFGKPTSARDRRE